MKVVIATDSWTRAAEAVVGPLPPPPRGPDEVVICDDQPGDTRDARLQAALDEVARRLIKG